MDFSAIWSGFDPAVKAAIIGAAATCVAAFFGFGAIVLQIGAQGRQSRGAIAENERRKLKAAMYEDALLVSRAMADAAIELSNDLRMMEMHLTIASQAAGAGIGYNLPSARMPALSASYQKFSDAALKVIFLIENHQIIDPRLLIFRTALSSILHDVGQLMFSEFVIHVMPVLPVDTPDGGVFPYTPPPVNGLNMIRGLAERFIDALGDAVAYSDDLLVELQNLLLGDLFQRRLEPRTPLDPSKRAITLEHAEELEEWLRTSTAWGKKTAAVDAETRAKFQKSVSAA